MIDFESNRFSFLFQLLESNYDSNIELLKEIEEMPYIEGTSRLISSLKEMYVLSKREGEIAGYPFFKLTLLAISLFKEDNDILIRDKYANTLFGILKDYSNKFKPEIEEKIRDEKKNFLEESISSASTRLSQVFGRELSNKETEELELLIIDTLVGGELYNDMTFQTFVILCGLETSTFLLERTGAENFEGPGTDEIISFTRDITRTFRTIYGYGGRAEFPGVEIGVFESTYPYLAAFKNKNLGIDELVNLYMKSQLDTSAGKDPSFNLLAYLIGSQDPDLKKRAVDVATKLLNPNSYDLNLNAMEGLSIIPGAREAIAYSVAKDNDLNEILPGLKKLLMELASTGKILYYDEGFPIAIAAGLNERNFSEENEGIKDYVNFIMDNPSIPGGNISGLLVARNYDDKELEDKFMKKLNPGEKAFLQGSLESGQFKEYMEEIWKNANDFGTTAERFYELLQNSFEYVCSDNFKSECKPRFLILKEDETTVELMYNRTPLRAFVHLLGKSDLDKKVKQDRIEKILKNNPFEFYLYASLFGHGSKNDLNRLTNAATKGMSSLNKLLETAPNGKKVRIPGLFAGNLSILEMIASHGIMLQETGRPKEAAKALAMVLEFDPSDTIEARGRLANTYLELKRYNELDSLLNTYSDDRLLEISAARALRNIVKKDMEAAEAAILQAMDSNPYLIDALLGTLDYRNNEEDHLRKELALTYAAKNIKHWAASTKNFDWLKKMKKLSNEMFGV